MPQRSLSLSMRDEAMMQSALGVMLWAGAVAVVQPGWAPALLLFGPLVLFPLLLERWGEASATLRRLCSVAILPMIVSYALPQGPLAGALALPWLGLAIALLVHRWKVNLAARDPALLIKAYLVVGAGWLLMARLGQRPLEFEDVIVHATAMHFHYAGFMLPILASLLLRAAPTRGNALMLIALLAGMPLVATGITLSHFGVHIVETFAACTFAGACIAFAGAQLRFGIVAKRPLLIVASVSLLTAMSLAILYAIRHYWRIDAISIDFMIRTHGPLQVLGFALPATISWLFAPELTDAIEPQRHRGTEKRIGSGIM